MKRVTIELEENTHQKVKRSSKNNNRSLRGEIKTIIESYFNDDKNICDKKLTNLND